jgi:APA family basic amino acid/polyamine antiporter
VSAIVLLVFSFADQPRNSIIGTIIILLGIPLHYAFQRKHKAA